MKLKHFGYGASFTLLALIAILAFSSSSASASPGPLHQQQHAGKWLPLVHTEAQSFTMHAPAIVCPVKTQKLVDVTYKVANDADSGDGGNYWALDAMTRRLQIWFVSTGQYCAEIKDSAGTFTTAGGVRSPGSIPDGSGGYKNGGQVDGTEVGTFSGGAVIDIAGTYHLNDPSHWPTSGSGNGGVTLNAGCQILPDGSSNGCPNPIHTWEDHYFASGYSETAIPTWGWRYIGKDHSTAPDAGTPAGCWNNFFSGDSGDVLDVD